MKHIAWSLGACLVVAVACPVVGCTGDDVRFGSSGSGGDSSSSGAGATSTVGTSDVSSADTGAGAGGATNGTTVASSSSSTMPCSEMPCKLVSPQCGCMPNEKCTIDDGNNGVRVCLPDGSQSEGELCNGNCVSGTICLPQDDQPALCKAFCNNDADCQAPGGRCILDVEDGNGNPVATACTMNCDPITSTGCSGSGTKCGVTRGNTVSTFATDCIASGTVGQFGSCTTSNDCQLGLGCIFTGMSQTQCLTWCDVNSSSCPNNLFCTPFQSPLIIGPTEYGVCI